MDILFWVFANREIGCCRDAVGDNAKRKKTQKTPAKEIKKAEEIRKQYLDYKTKKK